jgi:dTMP kinase
VTQFAAGERWPDLTFLLDLPVEVGLRRKAIAATDAAGQWTRFEAETVDFHERVRAGFRALAVSDPTRWVILDACLPAPELEAQIWGGIVRRLPGAAPSPLEIAQNCPDPRD